MLLESKTIIFPKKREWRKKPAEIVWVQLCGYCPQLCSGSILAFGCQAFISYYRTLPEFLGFHFFCICNISPLSFFFHFAALAPECHGLESVFKLNLCWRNPNRNIRWQHRFRLIAPSTDSTNSVLLILAEKVFQIELLKGIWSHFGWYLLGWYHGKMFVLWN